MIKYGKGEKHCPCIYKLTCLKNGLIYVGKTGDYYNRMARHRFCVEHPDAENNVWWCVYFNKHYGATDFARDYDAEIIEIVEDPELRNEREKYWIDKLQARNKSIGFNTLPGGNDAPNYIALHTNSYTRKMSENGPKFQYYFIYNRFEDIVDLVSTIRGVKEYIGVEKIQTIGSFTCINKGYFVVPFLAERRREYFAKFVEERIAFMKKLIESKVTTKLTDQYKFAISRINIYCRIEELITLNFGNIEGTTDPNIAKDCKILKDKVHHLYIDFYKYAVSAQNMSLEQCPIEEAAVIYDYKKKLPVKVCTMREAVDFLKIAQRSSLSAFQSISPIRDKYFVYPLDPEIKEMFRKQVKKSSMELKDRSPYKGLMWDYMCGYFYTNKLFGINKLITDF